MRRLQDSVLYLVIQLAILFNLERLDIAGANVINLTTAVYLLTVIAVILVLSVKWMRSMNKPVLMILWAAIYLIMKVTLMPRHPLVGGIYTYLTFTEFGMFLISVYLAHNLAVNIDENEQAVKNFAFAGNAKIKRTQEAQERINAEIYRSRRFQRSLSIIVMDQDLSNVRMDINKVVQDAQRTFMEQYISAMVVKEVSAQLRQTDILLEHEKGGKLIIVSPDTDDTGVKYLIERLSSLTHSGDLSLSFGTATFPDDGLTFEQLLKHADTGVHQKVDAPIGLGAPQEIEKNPALPVE